MKVTPELYSDMQRQAAPKSKACKNIPAAFAVGGGICALGQSILNLLHSLALPPEQAAAWTSVLLIGCSVILTGMGLYEKIAKHAGAGTLVPITGFANAIASSAMEAKSEGFILGVGTKIFTIAGPVLLYGSTAAALYGIVYWLLQRL